MIECGVEAEEMGGVDIPFTLEQLACMREAVGDEALAQLFVGGGDLPLQVLMAVLECGISLGD